MKPAAAFSLRSWLTRPAVLLALLVVFGWLGYVLVPRARTVLGVADYGGWFIDSYAVLAAVDAARAGMDPSVANPYDPLLRPHRYSDWWLTAGRALGLTREDNFVVGLSWVLLFVVGLGLTVRPRSRGEALWLALLLLSPSVLQGLLRANNDLLVFAVLSVAVMALGRAGGRGWGAAVVATALATGLKFYPVAAVAGLLGLRPPARLRAGLVVGGLVLAITLLLVGSQMVRGVFPIDPTVHVWGGRLWLQDLGLPGAPVAWAGLALGAAALIGWRGARLPVISGSAAAFAVAAAVLTACFVAGLNYGYRWIFALWLGPWLWSVRHEARVAWRGVAAGLRWLVPWLLWQDGLLCAVINLGWWPVRPGDLAELQHDWRLATQPLAWVAMLLLAGWLGAWARAAWSARHEAS